MLKQLNLGPSTSILRILFGILLIIIASCIFVIAGAAFTLEIYYKNHSIDPQNLYLIYFYLPIMFWAITIGMHLALGTIVNIDKRFISYPCMIWAFISVINRFVLLIIKQDYGRCEYCQSVNNISLYFIINNILSFFYWLKMLSLRHYLS